MPHIHAATFAPVALPAEADGCRYDFSAANVDYTDEYLIASEVEGKRFFLLIKEGPHGVLIKSDKITRPSAAYYAQKGITTYAALCDSEVLHTNIPEAMAKNPHLASDSALKRIEDFTGQFPQDREVRIEVGFGSGRHLLHQAKANPDILFIGIEIHKASIEQVLKQVNIQNLDNVWLLDYDARLFMEFVPSNLVGKIYVHFPVPWDKKPHRRVISEAFISESIRVLKPGGRLELRTDSENYFEYSWQTFLSLQKVKLEIFKNQEIEITSKYEDRWRKMEKNIYDVTMICDEASAPLGDAPDFSFPSGPVDRERFRSLNGTTERFEGGFLHFERLYVIDGGERLMARISLGSFDRPEHLYLIVGPGGAEYFPFGPVQSRTNHTAHTRLCELIYG
jgi:tRNA (guanine-N7-)-methyltransferase